MDDEAEPGDAGVHRQHLRPGLVNDQPQSSQPLDDRRLPRPQRALVVAEQGEVVDVAEIGAAAEFARHELIEGMQVAVGPELRGEIADRQPPRPADGKQVVAGKAHIAVFVVEHAAAAGDDRLRPAP